MTFLDFWHQHTNACVFLTLALLWFLYLLWDRLWTALEKSGPVQRGARVFPRESAPIWTYKETKTETEAETKPTQKTEEKR